MVGSVGPRFGRTQIAPICTTPAISRSPPTGAQNEPYTRATTRESCHCLWPVRVGEADDRERRPPMASGTRGDAKPIADVYGENGVHLTAAGKGPGSRIQGWQRWHSYLAEGPPARIIGRPDGRPAR